MLPGGLFKTFLMFSTAPVRSTYCKSGDAGGVALLTAALAKPGAAKSAFLVLHSLTDGTLASSKQADNNESLLARMQGLRHCSALLHQCSLQQ